MRGLKPGAYSKQDGQNDVASFTDAWIETFTTDPLLPETEVASFTDAWIETKGKNIMLTREIVASFTDAWIETLYLGCVNRDFVSHLLQMRGLKLCAQTFAPRNAVASFTDAWIETFDRALRRIIINSRIFYRCVD